MCVSVQCIRDYQVSMSDNFLESKISLQCGPRSLGRLAHGRSLPIVPPIVGRGYRIPSRLDAYAHCPILQILRLKKKPEEIP